MQPLKTIGCVALVAFWCQFNDAGRLLAQETVTPPAEGGKPSKEDAPSQDARTGHDVEVRIIMASPRVYLRAVEIAGDDVSILSSQRVPNESASISTPNEATSNETSKSTTTEPQWACAILNEKEQEEFINKANGDSRTNLWFTHLFVPEGQTGKLDQLKDHEWTDTTDTASPKVRKLTEGQKYTIELSPDGEQMRIDASLEYREHLPRRIAPVDAQGRLNPWPQQATCTLAFTEEVRAEDQWLVIFPASLAETSGQSAGELVARSLGLTPPTKDRKIPIWVLRVRARQQGNISTVSL